MQRYDNVRYMNQSEQKAVKTVEQGTSQETVPCPWQNPIKVGSTHFSMVCRLMERQQQGQKHPKSGRSVHEVRQGKEPHP